MESTNLRDWILKNDSILDRQIIIKSTFSPLFKLFKKVHLRSDYLVTISVQKFRTAFTHLRFQVMPTALLSGRFSGVPVDRRLCICGEPVIEDLSHYVLDCPLYLEPRIKHIQRFLLGQYFPTNLDKIVFLLSDTNPLITYSVSLFALAARKIRAKITSAEI